MHKINFSKASNTLQHPAMAAGFSPIVWVQIPAYIYAKNSSWSTTRVTIQDQIFPPNRKHFFL